MGLSSVLMVCASLTVVDGDTVKCDGQNLRPMGNGAPFVEGFDTPEIFGKVDCPEEREMGQLAKTRMAELLKTPDLTIENSGELDVFDRPLVVLRLPDGSTIGQRLIDENFAKVWRPGKTVDWCN